MKIDGINNIKNVNNAPNKNNFETNKVNVPQIKEVDIDISYEESIVEDESYVYDPLSIKMLTKESEDLYGQIIKVTENALEDQGRRDELLKLIDGGNTDEIVMAKAKDLISPEGQLATEVVSQNIVDLIKVASSGEKGKVDALIEAIDKVFKEIEDSLGQLPEISKRTYDSIIEKLDNFVSIGRFEKEPENAELLLKEIVKDMIVNQAKTEELLRQMDTVDGKGSKVNETRELIIPKDLVGTEGLSEKSVEEIVTSQTKVLELLRQIDRIRISDTGVTGLKELITWEEKIEMDQALIAEAKDLISLEGRLGAEGMSKKIVNLVKVFSDGDREKLDSLIAAINKSFKETKESLGLLPAPSKGIYDRVIRDLEDWEDELERRRHQGPAIFVESMNYYRRIKRYGKFGIKTYITIIFSSIVLYYFIRYVVL